MFLGLLPLVLLVSYTTGSNSFPTQLSAEEERKYLEEYANGSEEAKKILIERNLRLVAHIVKKYGNYSKDNEDLISVGTIGLIKGITTFSISRGTRLATYAARCIENPILTQWLFAMMKSHQIWLWWAIDHDTGNVVAYWFGAREHKNLDKLVELLEPLAIGKVYTDGNYAYFKRFSSDTLVVTKKNTQEIERKHLSLRT